MVGRVEGKVAVVTGGASGIGRACAERLAEEGAIIVVADVQHALGEEVAAGIGKAGRRAEYLRLDVSDEAAWVSAFERVRTQYGRLDVLVNNAGIGIGGPAIEMSLVDWRRQTAVNLDGPFLGIKHAVPFMAKGGGGSIINMCSSVGVIGQPMMAAYGATKGAMRVFTKAVALECALSGTGVRINAVHPGVIETPIWASQGSPDLDAMSQMSIPLGVKGLPIDIANGVLWLASDESRYVTGSELTIDGGATAGGTGPLFRAA
jgi:NAD(P)-dependent dehydrogenase (short-subunit alcohol dehydrogenase family)